MQDPEVKDLRLNGVSLTLQDVNLTLPSQKRDREKELMHEQTINSVDKRLADLQS